LHWSARNGHLSVVKFLVEECDVKINATTHDGTTAFCWSCWQGHLDIMVYLYSKGANVAAVNVFGCNAALWCAQSESDNLEPIKWLYSIGGEISLINFNGHSFLHKSAQRGKINFCKWICKSGGAGVDLLVFVSPDAEQCCPSDLAGMEGHIQLADWLAVWECEVASNVYQKYKVGERLSLPLWLKDGIESAKHKINRVDLTGVYESGSAVKRMAASVYIC